MDFLNNIPLNTTSGFIGLALLAIGAFMILAGLGIISIQQVTVKQGKATWIVGLIMALVGVVLLFPEVTPKMDEPSPQITESDLQPTVTHLATNLPGDLSDWRTVSFTLPDDQLWRENPDGIFNVIGSQDTIAWSEETFEGDLELTVDAESLDPSGEVNIILYGNGRGFSTGCLIFTIAHEHQKIVSDTSYEGGTFLFTQFGLVKFEGQKHTIMITIQDRKASLYLDGEQITSIFLSDRINSSGRIGLYKYWERPEMTFSNIRVISTGIGD
jgi:hypothetical protein